jgi:hypothetical protein
MTTASVSSNVITFTKGDGSTFDITVATGSGGGGASDFPYTGSAIISGSLNVIGSVTASSLTGSVTASVQYEEQIYPKNGIVTLSDAATINWDMNLGNVAEVTLGGNRTLEYSNAKAGATYLLYISQDATGGRTLTYTGSIKWPNSGSAPTLSTGSNAEDIIGFVSRDGSSLHGGVILPNYV